MNSDSLQEFSSNRGIRSNNNNNNISNGSSGINGTSSNYNIIRSAHYMNSANEDKDTTSFNATANMNLGTNDMLLLEELITTLNDYTTQHFDNTCQTRITEANILLFVEYVTDHFKTALSHN